MDKTRAKALQYILKSMDSNILVDKVIASLKTGAIYSTLDSAATVFSGGFLEQSKHRRLFLSSAANSMPFIDTGADIARL